MVTNQIMNREGLVMQRTKDGYFNANNLIENWNEAHPDKKKQIGSYKNIQSTKDYINHLITYEGIESPIISGRGINGGTWMHPKVFIDFAMWVSLEFKSKVIDWVLDGLIKSRHDAGDYYKEMCASIMSTYIEYHGTKPSPMIYINEAHMIKELLGIDKSRNELTEKELSNITTMQKVNTTLIEDRVGKVSRRKHLEIIARSL